MRPNRHPRTTRGGAAGRTALALLLLLGVLLGGMPTASAIIPGEDGGGGGEIELPPFSPPANGFDWSVPDRFAEKADGRFVWHWNEAEVRYDPAHVNPASWPMRIDGCQTEADLVATVNGQPTAHTYVFESATGQRIEGRSCQITATFPEEAKYDVRWSAKRDDGSLLGSWEQTVEIKDLLIVAMGDSYGSGEGAPEYNRVDGALWGTWVDTRCHRSSFAGAPQAARAIERSSNKTSVTFMSFACSGATINREYGKYTKGSYEESKHDPWAPFDPAKNEGSGVLAPYVGVQPPNATDFGDKIPSQVDQLVAALRGGGQTGEGVREVDALVMSAGGNDASFGPLAAACLVWDDCRHPDNKAFTSPSGGEKVNLETRVGHDLATMPGRYDALDAALDGLEADQGIEIAGTYVTEYPDPGTEVRNGRVEQCDYIMDDIFITLELAGTTFLRPWGSELGYARDVFLPTLNARLHDAAERHGWRYVDGVSAGFRGHGYCVGARGTENTSRYVQTAMLSAFQQGPYRPLGETETKGLLHPNKLGYQVYKNRIVAHIQPELALRGPDGGRHHPFPDTTPPSLPVVDLGTIQVGTWSGGPITITATSSDDEALARIEARIGEEPWTTMVGGTLTVTREGRFDLHVRAVDGAGNTSAITTIPLAIDTTGPEVVCGTADGLWHPEDVSIPCTASDAGSGIPESDQSFALSTSVSDGVETDGAVTAGRQVCDAVGNCTTNPGVGGNHVDRKVPDVGVDLPAGPFTVGDEVTVTYTCADAGSGVASCEGPVASGGSVDTATVGTRTFEVVGTDAVGNAARRTVSYEVHYPFSGLTGPVDAPPALNVVNGGAAVPVEFSLGGYRGLGIIPVGSPTSRQVACDASLPADAVEQTIGTAGPSLTYDAATDTYSLRWKTEKAWNGTCRKLTIQLADGTQHHALFRFGR